MSWCTPRTAGRIRGSSPGTAGGTRGASSPRPQCCPPSPPDPGQQQQQHIQSDESTNQRDRSEPGERCADLLVFGDWVEQLDVQFGVVLSQRLVAVVVDELHHGAKGERVGEAVLSLPMEDLYQLVVASFPAGVAERSGSALLNRN